MDGNAYLLQPLNAEYLLLGMILNEESEVLNAAMSQLTEEDFSTPLTRTVFSAIRSLYLGKEERLPSPVNIVSVADWIKRHGIEFEGEEDVEEALVELSQRAMVSVPDAETLIKTIKEASYRRKIVENAEEMKRLAREEMETTSLKDRVSSIFLSLLAEEKKGVHSIGEVTEHFFKEVETGTQPPPLRTDFHEMDQLVSFLEKTYNILSGGPGAGKTTLAINIATNLFLREEEKGGVLFFSLEMSRWDIAARVLARLSNVPVSELLRPKSDEKAAVILRRVRNFYERYDVENWKFYIVDSPVSVVDIRAIAKQLLASEPLSLIVVDQLQLLRVDAVDAKKSKVEQLTNISRNLKLLALETGVPLLVISQLSREREKTKRLPRLADLRGTGTIEYDADSVTFLVNVNEVEKGVLVKHDVIVSPDDPYPTVDAVHEVMSFDETTGELRPVRYEVPSVPVLVIVAKNRNGRTGEFLLSFDPATASFSSFISSIYYREAGAYADVVYPNPTQDPVYADWMRKFSEIFSGSERR